MDHAASATVDQRSARPDVDRRQSHFACHLNLVDRGGWDPDRSCRWHHPDSVIGLDGRDPRGCVDQLIYVMPVGRNNLARVMCFGNEDDVISEIQRHGSPIPGLLAVFAHTLTVCAETSERQRRTVEPWKH